jgi:hypothetical protein
MAKRIAPEEMHVWLKGYFRQRPDIGLGKAIVNLALNPRNPFEPEAWRMPRRGFLFVAVPFALAAGWFLYFNFAR